jgi:nitroreductase
VVTVEERRAQIPGSLGLSPVQVELLLTTAGRAPSLHNSQPWQFHVTERAIELYADPRRSPAVADPHGREMRMACGAALFNLQLALRAHAIRPIVTILPDRARPGLVAVVRHGGTKQPAPEHQELLRAASLWPTNRYPLTKRPVHPTTLQALRRAAADEGAWLHMAADPTQQAAVRAIAARAHREQSADPAFRAELALWAADAPDRVPRKDLERESVIAVLSSHLSGASAEIRVGQALERVLLTASANGLATSFLSPIVEVPRTREELRRLIGGTRPPQAVLCIGHGRPAEATPRRDVRDLVTQDQGSP